MKVWRGFGWRIGMPAHSLEQLETSGIDLQNMQLPSFYHSIDLYIKKW